MTTTNQKCVLAIGNFDGVHIGHVALLQNAKRYAMSVQLPLHVLTFDPLPAEFFQALGSESATKNIQRQQFHRIISLKDRLRFLHLVGVQHIQVETFNDTFRQLSPNAFFHSIVMQKCQAKAIVVGKDFRFGKQRIGDISILATLCHMHNITLRTVVLHTKNSLLELVANQTTDDTNDDENTPTIHNSNQVTRYKISSRNIRQALLTNDIHAANTALGYSWQYTGIVVHGDKRGRTLGFPTANIHVPAPFPPLSGVFIASMHIENTTQNNAANATWLQCVVNIGTRPTFTHPRKKQRYCEVHVLHHIDEIYDCNVTIALHKHIRDEKRFTDIQHLVAQIENDIRCAKSWFTSHHYVCTPAPHIIH